MAPETTSTRKYPLRSNRGTTPNRGLIFSISRTKSSSGHWGWTAQISGSTNQATRKNYKEETTSGSDDGLIDTPTRRPRKSASHNNSTSKQFSRGSKAPLPVADRLSWIHQELKGSRLNDETALPSVENPAPFETSGAFPEKGLTQGSANRSKDITTPIEGRSRLFASQSADKMAPTYSRAQNRRQNRTGLVDHDIYEGLPVKQWRRDYVTVAPPPSQENTNAQNDIWAVELPWGMPKDSHMLPQHSQDLLRAARSGKIYKRPAPLEEEEAEAEIIPEKPEKKDDDLKDKGFTSKAWKQISRQSDASDFEYLAKRRKGLVGVAAPGSAPGPTLIKATVKRTDAGGNEYVQDVVVPQGQHVEGEVLSQTVIPGTNPLSAIPTPPRRKVPTSKKKKKHGPGRGRKKIVVAPTSAPAADGSGGDLSKAASAGAIGPDGVKIENGDATSSRQNDDVEMGGASNAASDHEDGDEGEDDDETEDEEGSESHASPSKITRPSSPTPAPLPTMKPIPDSIDLDTEMSGTNPPAPLSPSPRGTLGTGLGSPARDVDAESSALGTPPASSAPLQATTAKNDLPSLEHTMQEEAIQSAPTELPHAPPEPTIKEEIAAVQTLQEEEEEEEMLLSIMDSANVTDIEHKLPTLPKALEEFSLLSTEQEALAAESDLSEPPAELDSVVEDGEVENTGATEPLHEEDDDDEFPDLLGGLEASLA